MSDFWHLGDKLVSISLNDNILEREENLTEAQQELYVCLCTQILTYSPHGCVSVTHMGVPIMHVQYANDLLCLLHTDGYS